MPKVRTRTGVEDDSVQTDRVPRKLDGAADAGPRRRFRIAGSRRLFVLVASLVTLVAILAVATAVLAYEYARAEDRVAAAGPTDADRRAVLDTAKRYAVQLTSYDPANYADLDRRIREISTPEFAKSYIASSADARKGNANAKGVSTAKADNAGIESMTTDKAVVLVALDQTVTSSEIAAQVPQGIPYQSRVKLTLVRRDGTWLLDDLSAV
ncbi:hypothetical protein ACWDTD_11515 [Gordonia sp. NPDC003425]